MNEKVAILPNRDEMFGRLVRVSDEQHLQDCFYPILLRQAGQGREALGVVMMLTLAIRDYTKDMPSMVGLLNGMAPDFIDALIVDPEIAAEAKRFLR